MEKNSKILLIIIGVIVLIAVVVAYTNNSVRYVPNNSIGTSYNIYDTNDNSSSNYNSSNTNKSTTTNNTYNTNRSSSSSYNTYDTNKSTTNTSSGCQFKYSNGTICGRTVGTHSPLCDYHFNQLNDTYNSLVGK